MTEVLCIGSVLWDVIGRSADHMRRGSDVPGRIVHQPGGVALNIAMTLTRFDLKPALLSAVGRDALGDELIDRCAQMGMCVDYVYRSEDKPTDRYMAIEDAGGVIAAVADAHTLETAGAKILLPLTDGRLGSAKAPYPGLVALDGNLTHELLEDMSLSAVLGAADLRLATASPGKAERLRPFLETGRGTLYLNLEEAGILCGACFKTSREAALSLLECGAQRVLVTDGSRPATDADAERCLTEPPPNASVVRVTGAGDTFMAAHMAAEAGGHHRMDALRKALEAAADYVSGADSND